MTSVVVDSGGSGLEFDSSGVQIQSQVEIYYVTCFYVLFVNFQYGHLTILKKGFFRLRPFEMVK